MKSDQLAYRFKEKIPFDYPEAACSGKLTGLASVAAMIGPDGKLLPATGGAGNPELILTTTHKILDQAAVTAVSNAQFPATGSYQVKTFDFDFQFSEQACAGAKPAQPSPSAPGGSASPAASPQPGASPDANTPSESPSPESPKPESVKPENAKPKPEVPVPPKPSPVTEPPKPAATTPPPEPPKPEPSPAASEADPAANPVAPEAQPSAP
jgi:hypothetical protein